LKNHKIHENSRILKNRAEIFSPLFIWVVLELWGGTTECRALRGVTLGRRRASPDYSICCTQHLQYYRYGCDGSVLWQGPPDPRKTRKYRKFKIPQESCGNFFTTFHMGGPGAIWLCRALRGVTLGRRHTSRDCLCCTQHIPYRYGCDGSVHWVIQSLEKPENPEISSFLKIRAEIFSSLFV